MLGDVSINMKEMDYTTDDFVEESESKSFIIDVSIPKIEPLFSSTTVTNSSENLPNVDASIVTPIPFIIPYKVKDPVILLERCDKIWETFKVIKDIQDKKKTESVSVLSSKLAASNQLQKNAELPNFRLFIKSRKVLHLCTICGKDYTRSRTLRYHLEKVHGIYVPVKQNKYTHLNQGNINQTKEKESNTDIKEICGYEKVSSEIAENTLSIKDSLQSISLLDTNITIPDVYSQKRKRNNSVHNKNIDINKITKNEQEKKVLTKELKQNDRQIPNSLQYHSASLKCPLCKRVVKDMRNHLIDYHKIKSPDFILKKDEIIQDHLVCFQNEEKESTYVNPTKKRKTSSHNNLQVQSPLKTDTLQCNICLRFYKMSTLYKHMRIHRIRGETKENFQLLKINSNSSSSSSRNTNNYNYNDKNSSNLSKNKEKEQKILEIKKKKISNTCLCGRSFRNPYTSFIHKNNCTLFNEKQQTVMESKVNKTKRYVTRSSCDKDSGIGISITIKKKNDSYEIIDKSSRTKNQLLDCSHLKDTNEKVFQYSENHSIVKIQSIDENIDIDIEEDPETNFSNNNVSNSTSKIVNDVCAERMEQEKKIGQNNKSYEENFNSDFVQGKDDIIMKHEQTMEKFKEKHICVCGCKFSTQKAFEIHINKQHSSSELICGYCKLSFINASEWNKHQCSIIEGEKFIYVPMVINCHYCHAVLSSYKKFDEHMKRKHSILLFQCFQCNKQFPNCGHRKHHYDSTHKTICSICNNSYCDIMKSRHMAYHYGLGFSCHLCKLTYTSKDNLSKHKIRDLHITNYNSYKSSMDYTVHNL